MNAYEKRVSVELERLLGPYVAEVDGDAQQLHAELVTYVTEATRRSYINGLKANDRRDRGTRRPGEVRSAVQNGKLSPVPQEEGA